MPTLALIELTVADLERATLWYTAWFGVGPSLVDIPHGFTMFAAGPIRLSLKVGVPVPGTILVTFETPDLDADLVRLAGCGIVPEGPTKTSGEGYRRARFRDPDGHALSLFAWCA